MGKELVKKGGEALDDSGILDNVYVRGIVSGALEGFLNLYKPSEEEVQTLRDDRVKQIKKKGVDELEDAFGTLVKSIAEQTADTEAGSCTCGQSPHDAGCPLHVAEQIHIEEDDDG